MTHDEINRACRLSLLMEDARATRHNVYPIRKRQEAAAVAALRPRTGNVENVVPLAPRIRKPGPPDAA